MQVFRGEVRLLERKIETPTKRTYLFEKPDIFNFDPGQFVVVRLLDFDGSTRDSLRQFSISSSPEDEFLSISTQVIGRNSAYKDKLDSLRPGDRVYLTGPNGSFTPGKVDGDMMFIAGGVGITPFRSMLRHFYFTGFQGRIYLVHSSRNYDDILFFQELEDLKKKVNWLSIHRFLTRDSRKFAGFANARIDADQLKNILDGNILELFMVSGPPQFVDDVGKMLIESLGIRESIVKKEKFLGY
ncbi:MAG: hypothetical protein QW812_04340 [Thermoplasmataceae archaeon]